MIIKRVGPMSVAKISGTLYVLIGLIFGSVISVASVVGGAMGGSGNGLAPMLFGAAAVLILPVVYGAFGFVLTLIMTALFNMVAGWVGGVEVETE